MAVKTRALNTRSWREKHDNHAHPARISTLDAPFAGFAPGARLVIATPAEVSAYFRSVPRGETRTVKELRAALADAHGVDGACPLSTGILCRIAAEAAYEAIEEGASADEVAPFWRVVAPSSQLAKKLACTPGFIRKQRALERAPG